MRSLVPILVALACPIGMCLAPMLLMRRRQGSGSRHAAEAGGDDVKELRRLRVEVAALRSELNEYDTTT